MMSGDTFCGATPEENAKMRQYFNSLPPYIQETIRQSGIDIKSLDELESCAKHMSESE